MTTPKPKPQSKKEEKAEKKALLDEYREIQKRLAVRRDDGYCVFCFFLLGVREHAVDVHHVFGRGKDIEDIREDCTSLLCTCRHHHPGPILTEIPSPEQDYIVAVGIMANRTPINETVVSYPFTQYRYSPNVV